MKRAISASKQEFLRCCSRYLDIRISHPQGESQENHENVENESRLAPGARGREKQKCTTDRNEWRGQSRANQQQVKCRSKVIKIRAVVG